MWHLCRFDVCTGMPKKTLDMSLTGQKGLCCKELFLRQCLKKFLLYRRLYLYKCIGKENQGLLETDKELKILGKDLKKHMKENKSLSLKLCKEKKKKVNYKYQKHK